jgi:RNA polymerase sigma-70 factor, ECF subfamily
MRPSRVEPVDEQTLLVRAQAGDRAAFAVLVRAHQHSVYTLALRLTEDRELAADVAQETLIRAWRGLPGFRGEASLSTWLYRITANTAATHRRRVRRHLPLEYLDETPSPPGLHDPEAAGEQGELRIRLNAALRALTPPLRRVVVLKHIYGWSHGEIAESLGISVTAAKVRLHRAHRRLQRVLDLEAW